MTKIIRFEDLPKESRRHILFEEDVQIINEDLKHAQLKQEESVIFCSWDFSCREDWYIDIVKEKLETAGYKTIWVIGDEKDEPCLSVELKQQKKRRIGFLK